jgi:hypothetical protein
MPSIADIYGESNYPKNNAEVKRRVITKNKTPRNTKKRIALASER